MEVCKVGAHGSTPATAHTPQTAYATLFDASPLGHWTWAYIYMLVSTQKWLFTKWCHTEYVISVAKLLYQYTFDLFCVLTAYDQTFAKDLCIHTLEKGLVCCNRTSVLFHPPTHALRKNTGMQHEREKGLGIRQIYKINSINKYNLEQIIRTGWYSCKQLGVNHKHLQSAQCCT